MGIVLSGAGDDGAAGLVEIEKHGGSALVQDPREAASPSMPEAAIAADEPECLFIDDIAIQGLLLAHPSSRLIANDPPTITRRYGQYETVRLRPWGDYCPRR